MNQILWWWLIFPSPRHFIFLFVDFLFVDQNSFVDLFIHPDVSIHDMSYCLLDKDNLALIFNAGEIGVILKCYYYIKGSRS